MADTALALPASGAPAFAGEGRPPRLTWGRALTMALSLLVLAAAAYQSRELRLSDLTALIPWSPLFWLVFALRYLSTPSFDWLIFHRLWRVGGAAFVALLRKLIYNELLLGYLGEAYFYTWARRRLPMAATPFGAVKDVAILSAMAGNVMTLAVILIAYPYLALLPLAQYSAPIAWSLAAIFGISLGAMVLRRRIFTLPRAQLWMVFGFHCLRILVGTLLTALAWHLVLPDVQIGWWLVLSAIRLLVSRLPFMPNKDVVFAGIAVLALGNDVAIAALMAMMAALILATHLIVALVMGVHDLVKGDK